MKIALAILAILLVIGLLLGSSFVSRRNQMAIKREAVNSAWSQVDVVLQRRADLIPNLVETVKGFAAQEVTVFGDIAKARSALLSANTPADKIAANQKLDSALGRLLVVVENYPQSIRAEQSGARLGDIPKNSYLLRRKPFHRLHQVRNQVRAPLQDHVHLRPRRVYRFPLYRHLVPAAYEGAAQQQANHQQNRQDRESYFHDPCLLNTYALALPARCHWRFGRCWSSAAITFSSAAR